MKPNPPPQQAEGTPFEKFDRLFGAVIAVPKAPRGREKVETGMEQKKKRAKKPPQPVTLEQSLTLT